MFCCGGGPVYFEILGVAKNRNENNSIFMLLRHPDDDSGELVKFNSQTGTKTVLATFAVYVKIPIHLREYNNKLYVLLQGNDDGIWDNVILRVYSISGTLLSETNLTHISANPAKNPVFPYYWLYYPYKIAVYDENNIYVLVGGGVGDNNCHLFSGGNITLSFCPTGDFGISAIYGIETTHDKYVYLCGVSALQEVVRWYDRQTGVFIDSYALSSNMMEMYYDV